MHGPGLGVGPHEVTVFETLCQQAHTVAAPPQHLEAIALAAPKHEHVATEGVLVQLTVHDGRKPVEPAAHVGSARSQPPGGESLLQRGGAAL